MDNKAIKKIGSLLLLLLWAGGIICALVFAIGTKALVPTLAVVVVSVFSIPTAKRVFDILRS